MDMQATSLSASTAAEASVSGVNAPPELRETHTGIVVLIGDKAYKIKKPVATDFLDFSTPGRREHACAQEVVLNRRLAPDSYVGVAHLSDPQGGPAEPVIIMRRYPDSRRLAKLVRDGERVDAPLHAIADVLAHFHAGADRGPAIDAQSSIQAVAGRWQANLAELEPFADDVVPADSIVEVRRLVNQFIDGRSTLFTQRVVDRRIVDGHADLLADDIFCVPDGPVLLDCLEFDDRLRYVDGIDDAAFLAMDLEFMGRKDLGGEFLDEYRRLSGDSAPRALTDFYIAYRAVVRAKVDCVRYAQGHHAAAADARRHIGLALEHLRAGTVRLILVGGGPGTGKTTLARSLAEQQQAKLISTDDVRRQLEQSGAIQGPAGVLDTGLYSAENAAAVYDEVLRRARLHLSSGRSVIVDGTWRDPNQRLRARAVADETHSPIRELSCMTSLVEATRRIRGRRNTTSDATPEIAMALAEGAGTWHGAVPIDTGRPLTESLAEAHQVCCLAV
jgi:aminoglycoside phosphotransferase family enzyme/predicted kinase